MTCPDSALQFGLPVVCGYVPVPLDWSNPALGTLQIYFELYRPDRPNPAQSAILFNFGGPGLSTTSNGYGFLAFLFFSRNLDAHDILLIDDRGRGLSSPLDCADLQNGTAPFEQAIAECADQLGPAASMYGTGAVAQDTDAVRAALGYDKVDYFGWSYGGADVQAYATRFGKHLRSIVLDSPNGTPSNFPLDFDQARTEADQRLVVLDCLRSPTCAEDHPLPGFELDLLVFAVRSNPVEGDAYDAAGNPTHVRIDEEALLNSVIDNPDGNLTNTGEILAAGSSLLRGDPRPLLRLAAENPYGLHSFFLGASPTFWSSGAHYATGCVDEFEPWDWSASAPERKNQYDAAVAALPREFFFPFSKGVATGPLYNINSRGFPCLFWEKPTPSSPIAPPHAEYPPVPTLVLSGDLDTTVPLEITSRVAALYPRSTFVRVAEASHGSFLWSTCAANLESDFIENLSVDTTCAATPDAVWQAVGRFPRRASDARPAEVDPTGNNQAGPSERKVATVAVATATDAMQRFLLSPTGNGVGLRGGTFVFSSFDGTTFTVNLANSAFTEDITVSGTIAWSPNAPPIGGLTGDGSLTADLTVTGGGSGGQLHVAGKWQARGPVGKFRVTGVLNGKTVAVLIPAA